MQYRREQRWSAVGESAVEPRTRNPCATLRGSMRQVVISRHGTPDVLEVREGPDPTPAAGEVRIRVRAAGINFADVLARLGLYPDAPKPPCVVGYEVAGFVDGIGSEVTGFGDG